MVGGIRRICGSLVIIQVVDDGLPLPPFLRMPVRPVSEVGFTF